MEAASHEEKEKNVEIMETEFLLEGIFRVYGWDFRDYSLPSLRRRLKICLRGEKLDSISAFQARVLRDPQCMERLIKTMAINVTAMFRDPSFYRSFRKNVASYLKTCPFSRLWLVGCSTGEEAYSMAILLNEEGLLDKYRIYATDMSQTTLEQARSGIYPLGLMKDYTRNYQNAGGTKSFSEYYTASSENAILRPDLQKGIVWAQHNLTTDDSFNEFHVVICRNVMIYFNKKLQTKVHRLFYESLMPSGFLGLGKKESLTSSPVFSSYTDVDPAERIYRKVT